MRSTRKGIAKALKPYLVNYELYLMLIPVLAFYILFLYVPMYGVLMGFKDFNPSLGVWGSPWVGLKYFERFFHSYYFIRLLKNTIGISLYTLAVGFPLPILFALFLNEIRRPRYRKFIQNVTYMPYFLSLVVVVGMILTFTSVYNGIVNEALKALGFEPINFMIQKQYFKTIYTFTNVWQYMSFNAIIYIAALSSISPTLYEAADIDGASKFKKLLHISIPGIMPTIIIMFILRIGSLMNVDFQKILLMQNDLNLEASEVISTFVYKEGILKGNYSYSTAVGLFNSVINITLLVVANHVTKKFNETSLW